VSGVNDGLFLQHVALQGLLRTYSQYIQEAEAPAAVSSNGSNTLSAVTPPAAAAAAAAAVDWSGQTRRASFERFSSTLRPYPLFSGHSSSGEQEIFTRNSVNGQYSALLSPTRRLKPEVQNRFADPAASTAAAPAAAAGGGGAGAGADYISGSASTKTKGGLTAQQLGYLGSTSALRLEDFSSTLSNPIFRGRAALDWLSRHSQSGCGSMNGQSAFSSTAGGLAASTAAAAGTAGSSLPQPQQPLAPLSAAAAVTATPVAATAARAAAAAAAAAAATVSSMHSSSAKSEGCDSSLPSNMSHSLASTGFSTDSEALGQFVDEQVATDNFVITTETAPNTSHFQGKHLKAAAAAAAARAAAAKAKAAGADAAGIAAAAEAAAAAVAAAGTAAAPPTITEEDDYEIEFSDEDGQAPEFESATEAAIAAALERQQQQQQQRQQDWNMTERLPGDLIYEMLPGVDDAAIWATLPNTSSYEQQQQQRQGGGYLGANSSSSSSSIGSSAFASTLSGCNGSSGVTKAWMYGTGGFFCRTGRRRHVWIFGDSWQLEVDSRF
jgi:hypothetical protein